MLASAVHILKETMLMERPEISYPGWNRLPHKGVSSPSLEDARGACITLCSGLSCWRGSMEWPSSLYPHCPGPTVLSGQCQKVSFQDLAGEP